MNPEQIWTERENTTLKTMLASGATHQQIADALSGRRTLRAIGAHTKVLGIRPTPFVWAPEQDAELLALRARNVPFSVIARALDKSRCACIGRARRIGVPQIMRVKKPRVRRERKGQSGNLSQSANRARRRKSLAAHAAPAVPHNFLGVPLLDLEPNTCRYPQGDTPNILFCGQPVVPETSWCAHCSRIVFGKRPVQISLVERYRRLRQGKRNYKQARAA